MLLENQATFFRKPSFWIVVSLVLSLLSYYIPPLNDTLLVTKMGNLPLLLVANVVFITSAVLMVARAEFDLKTHAWAVVFFILCLGIMYHFHSNGLEPNMKWARHWFLQAETAFEGRLDIGPALGIYSDSAQRDGRGYLAYPIGSALLPIMFSKGIKIGIAFLAVLSCYLYAYLYRSIFKSRDKEFDVFFICSMVLFFLVQSSGTYYPLPFIGFSIFVPVAFLYLTGFVKNGGTQDLVISCFYFFLVSLFRAEGLIFFAAVVAAVFSKVRTKQFLPHQAMVLLAGSFSAYIFLLQNKLKWNDPFNSGIGFNPAIIQGPTFKPIQISFLEERFRQFFLEVPSLDAPYFQLQGSEPGGYLFFKYPYLAFFLLLIFFKAIAPNNNSAFKKGLSFLKENCAAFLVMMSGLSGLLIFLMTFGTSQKYHSVFVPLLSLTPLFVVPKKWYFRYPLHLLTLVLNLSLYYAFYFYYGKDQT